MLNWGHGEEASAGDARSELSACRMEKDYQGRRQRGRRGAGGCAGGRGRGQREGRPDTGDTARTPGGSGPRLKAPTRTAHQTQASTITTLLADAGTGRGDVGSYTKFVRGVELVIAQARTRCASRPQQGGLPLRLCVVFLGPHWEAPLQRRQRPGLKREAEPCMARIGQLKPGPGQGAGYMRGGQEERQGGPCEGTQGGGV